MINCDPLEYITLKELLFSSTNISPSHKTSKKLKLIIMNLPRQMSGLAHGFPPSDTNDMEIIIFCYFYVMGM